jgi:pilus assembly protein CpaE
MSETIEASLIMEAMHLGVKDFLTLPLNHSKMVAAIERIASREGLDKRAKIINVIPTIGGCGATTVACNVAAALATHAKSMLIDLDLVRGGVTNAFDVHPRYSIADVTDTAVELDDALVDNALAIHRGSKLSILGRPETPEDSQRVSKQGFSRLLSVVGRMFDYVLIDSMMSLDPLYAGALHSADINLLVMQLNIPSARNTERFVGALRRMGIDQSKIKVVRQSLREKRDGTSIQRKLKKALGLKISWTIPNDFKNAN